MVFSVANARASTTSLNQRGDLLYWKLPRLLANAMLARRRVEIETTADQHRPPSQRRYY
jgi:hypothetical protein